MDNHKAPPTQSGQNHIEKTKAESCYLRGRIAAELAEPTDRFTDTTAMLLRYHGVAQQEDRDRQRQLGDTGRKPAGAPRFMVRTGSAGGRFTSEQLLAHLDLSDELGSGSLRITSRQTLQIYGIEKRRLREAIRRINAMQLTTKGTAGDVLRNVTCCPAPYRRDPVHGQMQWMAGQISEALRPQIPAYREIWLDEASTAAAAASGGEPIEPLYGETYLPRKFKVAVGLPGDNCVDVYSQDVGLMAVSENFDVVGYNVLAGGGMGRSPTRPDTFAALAQPMAFCWASQAVAVVAAILKVYRDHGCRSDRRRSRLKYLVADWGLDRFKAEVEQVLGYTLTGPRPDDVWDIDDHLGWREQGDGRWFYGLYVENGRIFDRESLRVKSALREVCGRFHPAIYLTAGHSLLLGDVIWEDRVAIEDLLRRHGVMPEGDISNVRRWSAACVALPTCPRATTEAERVLPELVSRLESEVARLGLAGDLFSIRMSGCSNGCSRPYMADVGFVGHAAGRYAIYLGGRRTGDRLGYLYRDGVPLEQILGVLMPVLAYFKRTHSEGETLGDFCHRVGRDDLLKNA